MKSIRSSILAWSSLGVAALLVVTTTAWYRQASSVLETQFDRALAASSGTLATLLRRTVDGVSLDFADELVPEYFPGPEASYFTIWVGSVELEQSISLRDHGWKLNRQVGPLHHPLFQNVTLPDGKAGRSCGATYVVRSDRSDTGSQDSGSVSVSAEIVVARPRNDVDEALADMRWHLLALGTGLLGLTMFVVAFTVTRGLSPLRDLGRDVAAVDAAAPPAQVGSVVDPQELTPIVAGINVLLQHVRESMAREKRTTANLAHELLTPVAELRALVDVAQEWHTDSTLTTKALAATRDIAHRMDNMAVSVLGLARTEAGAIALAVTCVDLATVVNTCIEAHRGAADAQAVTLEQSAPPTYMVRADATMVSIVVRNLLANAIAHSPQGGSVRIHASLGSVVTLHIDNANPGLREEDLKRFGEPWWQQSPVRSHQGSHRFGLGLALVRELCRRAQVSLTFSIAEGRIEASVGFPGASESTVASADST